MFILCQVIIIYNCTLVKIDSLKFSKEEERVRRMLLYVVPIYQIVIIESVDSISRDGPDTPIYIIHDKKRNNSEQENFKRF